MTPKQKEEAMQNLLSHPDVVEDLLKNLVFEYDIRLERDNGYEDKACELENDLETFAREGRALFLFSGFKHQRREEVFLPVLVMHKTAESYMKQVDKNINQESPAESLLPIMSFVLYAGADVGMDDNEYPDELFEKKMPANLRYVIWPWSTHVYNLWTMWSYDWRKLRSDIRFVVDWYLQIRETGNYALPETLELRHPADTLKTMQAVTNVDLWADLIAPMEKLTDGQGFARFNLNEWREHKLLQEHLEKEAKKTLYQHVFDEVMTNEKKAIKWLWEHGREDEIADFFNMENYTAILKEMGRI